MLHLNPNLPSYKTQYLQGYGLASKSGISKKNMFSWLSTYLKVLLAFPFIRNSEVLKEIPKMYYVKYQGYKLCKHLESQRIGSNDERE